MDKNWQVEQGLAAAGFAVEVRRYQWPTPNELVHEQPEPILGLALGPPPVGESRPRDGGSGARYRKIGRLFFTPARIPFDIRGSGGEMLIAACSIAPDLFDRLTEGLGWDEPRLEACSDVHGTQINDVLTRLVREAGAPGFASDLLIEAAGTMIAIELARFFRTPGRTDRPKARLLSTRQLAVIEDLAEAGTAISLGEIAAQCGLSVRTLTRNFKATTGRTISSLIEQARVRQAKILLEDHSLPLKLVAHRTGFTSVGGFSTAFKRATGQLPGAFRRAR